MNWCEDNVLGKLTNDSFELKFTYLIKQWEEHYSNMDFSSMIDKKRNFKNDLEEFPTGAISGVVLNISRSSLQYWDTPETRSVVGTIVVQDIVGAIIGGVSGGVGSAVIGGEWNWGLVAWGAGVGAITGSTGVVGKVSKWVVSLFQHTLTMDWKNILVIIIAGTLAGIFAPKVTPFIIRWLEKKGILKGREEDKRGLNKKE